MEKIASGFIRNSASLGGNLVMAQRNHFPSDIATVLLAVGSTVNIMNSLKSEELTLEEFLRRPELDSKSILVGVKIPDWDRIMGISSGTEMKLLFETYRAAPRPLGNALPYLNAALMAKVSRCTTSIGIIAVKLLRGIVVPDDGTSSPAYRSSLAVSFLFEFFSHLVESNAESPDGCVDGYSTLLSPAKQLDHGKISTLLSSAKQEVELNRQYRPVGEPIAKSGAAIQASGLSPYAFGALELFPKLHVSPHQCGPCVQVCPPMHASSSMHVQPICASVCLSPPCDVHASGCLLMPLEHWSCCPCLRRPWDSPLQGLALQATSQHAIPLLLPPINHAPPCLRQPFVVAEAPCHAQFSLQCNNAGLATPVVSRATCHLIVLAHVLYHQARAYDALNLGFNLPHSPRVFMGARCLPMRPLALWEAVYVDDIPSPTNCLHGAFIYGTKPLARVKGIKLNPKSVAAGVSALISFKDIPGENIGCKTMFGTEPLFADDFTRCAGEYIAFVVADTQKHANMAANLAVIDYDMENLEPPILSVEEAVRRSSFFEVPSIISPKQVGDFSRGMAEADHKILSAEIRLGSQYYFYMETQTALAVPDEDNCIVVYSSIQCPEYAHTTISRCLGIPEHNVRVITRRVGGGFGGKAMKAIAVATACALAAYKLQRPVRIYMNRKTDMKIAGGRHPMKVTYSVGFKSNGKITALHVDILINAGMGVDISPAMPMLMVGALKKYDWGAFSFDIKVCKTNHLSKSAMRAPGEVQATFISEAVIEHVASTLSMDVDSVRSGNLHTFNSLNFFFEGCAGEPVEYTLPLIWDKLATSSSFKERTDMVKQFNMCNKWQKRGISRVPIVHEISLKATPGKVSILSDGSVAVEVGGIELGQGLWTKVKQMTAFALSSIGCDGMGDFLEKVRVIQSDTLSLIQGGLTTASTTSECSCEATRLCCNMLVKRLTPIKERLQEQMGSVEWGTLILQAQSQAVNLSASSYYVPDFSSFQYLNYGAAVSGGKSSHWTNHNLQSDIIYDCGQSLNPAVDLGQIEGAFVQGIGFFMLEEYTTNSDGLVVTEGTWTYKIPTIDTIPKQFNVEKWSNLQYSLEVTLVEINGMIFIACEARLDTFPFHYASGEPPLLLAVSVHCATRAAIREARQQLLSWTGLTKCDSTFQLEVPATMPVVKELCGLENVESYLQSLLS
ncbi:Abscisic-aldehyde oxidase [Vitis vinifera]|uniref:indole-3-acetaldehyde oxidase n=1 Tax=Vitis vinifera TaxID=29760 RepID=A0A438C7U7_VITVI|nr:Abscisic-aldehyde oxidase [Vitis vinifera]